MNDLKKILEQMRPPGAPEAVAPTDAGASDALAELKRVLNGQPTPAAPGAEGGENATPAASDKAGR